MAATSSVTWLSDGSESEAAVTDALGVVAPDLARLPLKLNERIITADHRFFQGSGFLGAAYVVKFAWSEPAARRIVHEGAVLRALRGADADLPVPEVVVTSASPALLVTRLVAGEELTWEAASALSGGPRARLVADLGRFLAQLHDEATLRAVAATVTLPAPEAQATTDAFRSRFGRLIEPDRRPAVDALCAWVDETLAAPSDVVLLHGDLGGHKLGWRSVTGELTFVADFETAAAGERAFDFRYLPGQTPTVDLFLDVVASYERASGHHVDLAKVMAWHTLTVLGDALWRGEAEVALPGGGGRPTSWVDELQARMRGVLGGTAS